MPRLKSLVEDAQDRHDSNVLLPDYSFPPHGHAAGWRDVPVKPENDRRTSSVRKSERLAGVFVR
jgi:hypothetical protein